MVDDIILKFYTTHSEIRRFYDKDKNVWLFSVADTILVFLQLANRKESNKYWNKLKNSLKKDSLLIKNIAQIKLVAPQVGTEYLTDVIDINAFLILADVVTPSSPEVQQLILKLAHLSFGNKNH